MALRSIHQDLLTTRSGIEKVVRSHLTIGEEGIPQNRTRGFRELVSALLYGEADLAQVLKSTLALLTPTPERHSAALRQAPRLAMAKEKDKTKEKLRGLERALQKAQREGHSQTAILLKQKIAYLKQFGWAAYKQYYGA